MRRFSHITISFLIIVIAVGKFNYENISLLKILMIIGSILLLLLIVNVIIWLIHFIEEKVFLWLEKRKQKDYSLMDWLGDANIPLELYSDLSEVKNFSHGKFYENNQIIKEKIKAHYPTLAEIRSFKFYLELRTGSQKYTAILNSTQTILIAIIIPTVLTLTNLNTFNSTSSSISAILFLVFWLILLAAIDFITKQIDKMKDLLRLVNECIVEFEHVN